MDFTRRTAQMMHEDHMATILVIEALDRMIGNAGAKLPDLSDATARGALQTAASAINHEVGAHFKFEEDELFTRLTENGDDEICIHLQQDHDVLLPLALDVAARAEKALADGFTADTWAAFKSLAGGLSEQLFAHIEKEENALLPLVDDLLDADTDMTLSTGYAAAH